MSSIVIWFMAPPIIIMCICIIVFIVCTIINFFISIGNVLNSVFPADPPVPDSKYTMDKMFGYPFLDKLGLFLIYAGIAIGCVMGGMYLFGPRDNTGIQPIALVDTKSNIKKDKPSNMQMDNKLEAPPNYEQVMNNQQKSPPDFNQPYLPPIQVN